MPKLSVYISKYSKFTKQIPLVKKWNYRKEKLRTQGQNNFSGLDMRKLESFECFQTLTPIYYSQHGQ